LAGSILPSRFQPATDVTLERLLNPDKEPQTG
jgi:hypothetical protein